MPQRSALITGITGQDGSYLAESLLKKGYAVFGLQRRLSVPNIANIAHIQDRVQLLAGDLLDPGSLVRALQQSQADEVYNLAAQSFVATSWEQPILTGAVTGMGVANLLEAVRLARPTARVYQASSSEMFGNSAGPQSEATPFRPRSPYGAAKVFAHHLAVNYRESFGLFCCCGILFNHESPRRGVEFVTRKVARAVARIRLGMQQELSLGNLQAARDWGYAPEYVEAMWAMLQRPEPSDYVVATGEAHTVQDWVAAAFDSVGMDWRNHVRTDPTLVRPAEIHTLLGDATRASRDLDWRPRTEFRTLVGLMVEAELLGQAHPAADRAAV